MQIMFVFRTGFFMNVDGSRVEAESDLLVYGFVPVVAVFDIEQDGVLSTDTELPLWAPSRSELVGYDGVQCSTSDS